ncbi:MAG: glycosyltransferase 87 family protein [Elusimicrobiota bacterium]|nr:glycosyltransferase 87 family protein [Elusimicrobiota bacterium]
MTRFLLRAGLASALGAVALALLAPLVDHVPAFLCVLALWTFVSWLTWRRLTHEPLPGIDEGDRMALILVVAAFSRLALVLVPPTPSTDAYRYSWEGRVANAGRNPYLLPPSSPDLAFLRLGQDERINNQGLTAIYPPLALAAFRAIAAVTADTRAQKGFFSLCDLLACVLLMRLLRRRGISVAWAAVYAWHPLVLVEFSAAGHLDSLMILGLLAGLDLWESGRRALGAAAWATATLVKVAPIILLPWLFFHRPRSAALFLAVICIGLIPAVPGLHAALRVAPESGIAAFASDWLANPSLYAVLWMVVESASVRRLILVAAVGAFSLPWARRCADDAARYLCGMILAILLASPVVQPWYVLWALPFALLAPSPTALAWSWIVGFMYFAIDPALRESSARLPWWHWLWIGEYVVVYGLLGRSLYGACNERRSGQTHLATMEIK